MGGAATTDGASRAAFAALGGWPAVLGRLVAGDDLTADEAGAALGEVLAGCGHAGADRRLRHRPADQGRDRRGDDRPGAGHARPTPSRCRCAVPSDVVDTCGTGGDRSRSINVSTIAALVVAGAGARVCKHGGRAASSAAGSADVLEALGVVIDLGPDGVARCIDEAGIGLLLRAALPSRHALRHPGARASSAWPPSSTSWARWPTRPGPACQVVGVSDPAMADKMLGVLVANGCRRAMVVHGADGLDELSTTGPSTVLEVGADAEVRRYTVDPADLGLPAATLDDLRGGDAAANAEVVRRVLAGKQGPHRDIAVLNAAAGLVVAGAERRSRRRRGAGRCRHRRRGRARRAREPGARLAEAAAAVLTPAPPVTPGVRRGRGPRSPRGRGGCRP